MNHKSLVSIASLTARIRRSPVFAKLLVQRLLVVLTLATATALAQSYQVIDLGSLPGNDSNAAGINAAGDVVGYSMSTSPQCCAQAFLWHQGKTTYAANAPITYAAAISDSGTILGNYDISGGAGCYEAFLASSPASLIPQPQTATTF